LERGIEDSWQSCGNHTREQKHCDRHVTTKLIKQPPATIARPGAEGIQIPSNYLRLPTPREGIRFENYSTGMEGIRFVSNPMRSQRY
jgi:hypothetical protein